MKISIIIPTYNRNEILYKHLAIAYTALVGLDCEIIVVNDSKTNAVEIASIWGGMIQVYNNPKQGVASARNYGASKAKSDILLFVDDDMMLNRNAVESAISYMQEHPDVCLNINWIYPDELRSKLDGYAFGRYLEHFGFTTLRGWIGNEFKWEENKIIEANGITSQFLAMSKSTFQNAGGYNEDFPFAGYEDYDFGKRLLSKGTKIYINTGVVIRHNEEDRVQLDGWMKRKYRGGQTMRVAVQMGHKELELNYNNLKGKIYFLLSKMEFVLITFIRLIPNYKLFDPIYFRYVNILLGTNLYKGYTKQ